MDWPQVVTITVSVVTAVIGSIAALAYFLGRRFERVDAQIRGLDRGLSVLASQFSNQLTLIGSLIRILHNRNTLSDEEFREIQTSYTNFATRGVEDLISRAEAKGNPLTGTEANRLRQYIQQARRGDAFTYEEIEDYNYLANKVAEEEPNDTSVWTLVALGAFLLGIYVGTRAQHD